MDRSLKFEPLKRVSKEEVQYILKENNIERLRLLPLSVGEYCEDWKFAQDICLCLTQHTDGTVKANSMLGISYIARNHNKIEKNKIKAAYKFLIEQKMSKANRSRVLESMEDIYIFMKWKVDFCYMANKIRMLLNR